jgi:HD-GYP domain-containing protein (c-di-GMP phosphodiesterase class II)
MRFIPVQSLMEGMVIAKSLYDINQQLLLREGTTVQKGYIERIARLGYQGIYIDDEISKDIEVKDVIRDELRMKAIQSVKDAFIYNDLSTLSGQKQAKQKIDVTKMLITNIVEEILENKDTMINLIDLKFFDDYTFFHSVNVAVLSILIGAELGLSREQLFNLGLASILHDIGKIFIDKDILNKPEALTESEYTTIRKHSEYGYTYLKNTFEIPAAVYVAVLQHHEHYNGLGYPNQKSKEDISLLGRIICVADVYDALTSNRPYRKGLLPSEAMEYIMANGGIMFDIKLTKIFARKVAPYPVGTYVRLSTGDLGIVVKNNSEACMRPIVKVFVDKYGNKVSPQIIDLKEDRLLRNVTITGVNDIA